jgi:Tfp pilus assembly protein PilE
MIVVAIVAILAAIIIPSFTGEAKKVKAKSEVNAMVAELGAKEERYKNESNAYLAVPECPTPVNSTPKAVTACQNTGDPWLDLGVIPTEQNLRCSYEITVGDSSVTPTAPSGATYTIPTGCCATSWYIIHARCDIDNDGVISHYVTASFDGKVQITNEGE